MADIVRDEVWPAKTKAFLPNQALISRVLKQRKFKYDEGVSLNEQGQLFYLQMIVKMRWNTVWSRKWRTPPTNAPGKATKPSISLPDIKVLMLFQVIDENNMWTQFVLQFLWISSPPSFFFQQEKLWCTWFHWDSNMDSHLVRLYLVLSQQMVQKWKAKTILRNFHAYFIFLAWILFKI